MRKMSSRRGFTLAEVLVTVTIIAVLAAVMVPAVLNQVAKGDSPAVANDIAGIRTAITTFAADTRHFPQRLSQLGAASLTSADKDILGAAYDAVAQGAYKGPYASITGGHLAPAKILFADSLISVNPRQICMNDSTSTGSRTGTSMITAGQVALLELALDQNATPLVGAGANSTGSVQWVQTGSTGAEVVTAGSVKVCLTTY
jgi:prepilin-type N-terminal cleavage/methylation domain-containing protein